MGRRGPLPTPKAVRLLEGTYREKRDGGEIVAPAGLPLAPDWLTPQERSIFTATVEQLSRVPGLLARIDAQAVSRYVRAWVIYFKASDEIDVGGITTRGAKGGIVKHPAVDVQNSADAQLSRFEARFGMTPGDRASIGRAIAPQKPEGVVTRQRA
jgi:P27 family predicted phage terminase small subunit